MTKRMNFIIVPRELFAEGFFPEESYSRRDAFLDLVQRAAIERRAVRINGKEIVVERGEIVASVRYLATRWGWSKGKVERALNEFESWGFVGRKRDNGTSIISIVNYDSYQGARDTDEDTNRDRVGDDDRDKYKELKKERTKEQKKTSKDVKENTSRFVKPSVEEIEAYCQEEGFNIDANRFFDYYESKGWFVGKSPMKNWKAAVRTWVSKNKAAYNGGDQLFPDNQPQQQKKREPVSGFTVVSGGFDFK